MELRYLGFDQLQNARGYRFNLVVKGDATRQFVVTVDLALFLAHRVGIQEGAQSLCAEIGSRPGEMPGRRSRVDHPGPAGVRG